MKRNLAIGLLAVWAFAVVPVWLIGMGFASEFRLLPDAPLTSLRGFAMMVAMYLPPVSAAILLLAPRHPSQAKNDHARNS